MPDEMKAEMKTCPRGHIHGVDEFLSFVDLTKEGDEAIIFTCPGGKREHQFNIIEAVACKMFTIYEAFQIVMNATIHRAKTLKEAKS